MSKRKMSKFQEKYDMYKAGYQFSAEELNEQTDEEINMPPLTEDTSNNTFLFWMIKNKDGEVPKFIEKYKKLLNLNIQNSYGWTPLTLSVRNSTTFSSIKTVKALLKAGVNVNIKDNDHWTALMHSAANTNENSNLETLKILIDAGADLNAQEIDGWTALMLAANNSNENSNLETVKTLIAKGADVNIQDNHGGTALIYSIINSDKTSSLETMVVLIEAGADVNAQDIDGHTVLMFATDYVKRDTINPEAVEVVIKAGASFDNNFNVTISGNRLKELLKMEETVNDMVKYTPGNNGYKEVEEHFKEKSECL